MSPIRIVLGFLLAVLLHGPVGDGAKLAASEAAVVKTFDADIGSHASVDITTRKLKRVASLEEFFAIDDDPDQCFKVRARVAPLLDSYTLVADAQPVLQRSPIALSHRHCAAPPTGPPRA